MLDSGVLSVSSQILLWLWELERTRAAALLSRSSSDDDADSGGASTPALPLLKDPVILFITANDYYAPFLETLKQRGYTSFDD